ncbi:MAG TPA: hypothetical protein VHA52_03415 [Candidatus Babeliaceae bacterium]|nr:hypothetical protein [Candidatus Babeliaceae bacterium]
MKDELFIDDNGELKSLREKIEKERLQAELDHYNMLNKLKNYLFEYYEPVSVPSSETIHFTTFQIWHQLLKIYPNELILTQDVVASWLHAGGFTFFDFGFMKLEWIMKRK